MIPINQSAFALHNAEAKSASYSSPFFRREKPSLIALSSHRGNPKAAHRFLAARHFIDKTENEFSLAPCVAGIDDFGNVCPVHKLF